MRRLHAKLRLASLWLVMVVASLAGGCSASPDSDTSRLPTGTGNTIKPPPDPNSAARDTGMAKSGQAMAADMAKAAQEMKAAKERTGGK